MVCISNISREFSHFLKQNILVLAVIFYLPFLIQNAITLYRIWPTFIWEELFISYAGGFVRRGLTGEILYFLQTNGINIRIVVPLCVVIFSLAFLIFCFSFVRKNMDRVSSLFISLSPGIFIFGFITFGAFARKDGIVAMVFILLMILAQKDGIISRFLFGLLICLGILIHESLIFYLPMPLMLLYLCHYQKNKSPFFPLFVGFSFCAVFLFILYFSGEQGQYQLMEMEWRSQIHDFKATHLMTYIGRGLKDVYPWISEKYLHLKSIGGILLGLSLTLSPIVYWALRIHLPTKMLVFFPGRYERILLLLALLSPCGLMLIEPDFGRRISLFAIELIFFLIFFCNIKYIPTYAAINFSDLTIYILIIYAFSWKIEHYVHYGMSICVFSPKLIFKFFIFSSFVFVILRVMKKILERYDKHPYAVYILDKLRYLD